jgi:hypothetical protein
MCRPAPGDPPFQVESFEADSGEDAFAQLAVSHRWRFKRRIVLLLGTLRGRWRPGAEIELAERIGLTEPEIRAAKRRAEEQGLLDSNGRLTDDGHSAVEAGLASNRRRPDIPSEPKPYYPWSLRVPRVAPSARRLTRRP